MKFKRTLIILSLVSFACISLFAFGLFRSASLRNDDIFAFLPPSMVGDVQSIELLSRGKDISLEKRDAHWFVVSGTSRIKARETNVNNLLALLSVEKNHPERGFSKSVHAELGLQRPEADQIILRSAHTVPILSLLVGSVSTTALGFFVRLEKSDTAYLAEEDFSQFLGGDENYWYNLDIFSDENKIQESDLVEIKLAIGSSLNETFVRSPDGSWHQGDNTISSALIGEWVQKLLFLSANTISTETPSVKSASGMSIDFVQGNGTVRSLRLFGEAEDGGAWLSISGSPYLYRCSAESVKLFLGPSK